MKAFSRATGLILAAGLWLAPPVFADALDMDAGADPDPFAEWTRMDENALADSSGGASLTINGLGMNMATNTATLSGNSVDGNVTTGQITNNNLQDVGGINSLMFNTGNNVNFQSNMQVNIFLN